MFHHKIQNKSPTSIVEPVNRSIEYAVPYQGSFKSERPSNFVDSQNILYINYKTKEQTNDANGKKNLKTTIRQPIIEYANSKFLVQD